jgi:hypothetical protein
MNMRTSTTKTYSAIGPSQQFLVFLLRLRIQTKMKHVMSVD